MVYEFDELSGFHHDYNEAGDHEVRISGAVTLGFCDPADMSEYNDAVTDVSFADNVTDIEDCCFNNCWYLSSVQLPAALRSIGAYAFCFTDLRGKVDIPDGVVEMNEFAFALNFVSSYGLPPCLHDLPYCGFYYDYDLVSVDIPSGVSCVNEACFQACFSMSSVTLRNGLSVIDTDAFANCDLVSVRLPDTLRYVGVGSFAYNPRLDFASFPPSIDLPDGNPFYGCSALVSCGQLDFRGAQPYVRQSPYGVMDKDRTLVIPLDEPDRTASEAPLAIGRYAYSGKTNIQFVGYNTILTGIYDSAFEGCSDLTGMSLGQQVSVVGDYAFCGCNLMQIRWAASERRIGSYTFANNANLVSAEFPPTVSSFEYGCFAGCSCLNRLVLSGDYSSAPSFNQNAFPANVTIIVKDLQTLQMFSPAVPSNIYRLGHMGQVEDVADLQISAIPDMPYTGDPVVPILDVRSSAGRKLLYGVEYGVKYENNVDVGVGRAIVVGGGLYFGERTVTFNITPADIADGTADFADNA